MDIRYFEFLDRLKRGDKPDDNACLRGETDNRTRLLPGELGVQIPPEAQIPPHLLYGRERDNSDRAARRAEIIRVVRRAEQEGLYDESEHLSGSGAWLEADGILPSVDIQEMMRLLDRFTVRELTPRKTKMFVVIDKFDKNQCCVRCPCGAQFDDWATLSHTCPGCGAVDEGV